MPPASFVGASAGVCNNAGAIATFTLPAATKAGDTVLLAIGAPTPNVGPDVSAGIWELVATFVGAASKLWILRREATAVELGNTSVAFPGAFPAGGVAACGVWRGLDTGRAVVASNSTNVAAAVAFPCPSLALTTYSDLYVGIAFGATAASSFTPPPATTERLDTSASAMTIEIFDVLLETTGASGIKSATGAVAMTGIAAAVVLAATPLVGFGKSFAFDPVGSIGLPSEGV